MSVSISVRPYIRINLHAAKNDQCCLGYLLGKSSTPLSVSRKGVDVNITNVLPICHSQPIGPIMEIAGSLLDKASHMDSVDSKAMDEEKDKQEDIVGLYYVPDLNFGRFSMNKKPYYLDNVMEMIKRNTTAEKVLLAVLDSSNINGNNHTLTYYEVVNNTYTQIQSTDVIIKHDKQTVSIANVNKVLDQVLSMNGQYSLLDVEDRLNEDDGKENGNKQLGVQLERFIDMYVANK
jgi:hypothetical protein